MSWREKAKPIIADVIATVGTDDRKALRKALREAYPFGQRQYHPYRIWCDEIARQLGEKPVLGTREKKAIPCCGQMDLFNKPVLNGRHDGV